MHLTALDSIGPRRLHMASMNELLIARRASRRDSAGLAMGHEKRGKYDRLQQPWTRSEGFAAPAEGSWMRSWRHRRRLRQADAGRAEGVPGAIRTARGYRAPRA